MVKVALVGRPNAGKSSLFNRFLKYRDAITSDTAGTTRDVKKRVATFNGYEAELYDTGGLEERDEMFVHVKKKALEAGEEADIVLFVIDSKVLPDDEDKKIFYELQESSAKIALVVNKIDNERHDERLVDFYTFGADYFFPVSCSHNKGITKLENWVSTVIQDLTSIEEEPADLMFDEFDGLLDNYSEEGELVDKTQEDSNEIKVAIIGRPNVGKSSLLNALIGEERSVVSSIAGTTIDPVDETMEYGDKKITFVDTAGVRKRSKILGIEKLGLHRTEKMLEQADIALLTLDASSPFTEQDEKVAGLIDRFNLGTIIVINKYDIAHDDYEKLKKDIKVKFRFLEHAPFLTTSAKTKKRTHKLLDMILDVYTNYSQRIPTSELNEVLRVAMIKHHAPTYKTKPLKIYFATQFQSKPPKIALVCNHPQGFHFSFLRYLKNQLREAYNFTGSPLVLIPRKRGEKFDDDKNDPQS